MHVEVNDFRHGEASGRAGGDGHSMRDPGALLILRCTPQRFTVLTTSLLEHPQCAQTCSSHPTMPGTGATVGVQWPGSD